MVQFLAVRASTDKSIKVTKIFFSRDLIFYFIMNVYLLVIMLIIKYMNLYIALGFLGLYTIFVIIVVYQSKNFKEEEDDESK